VAMRVAENRSNIIDSSTKLTMKISLFKLRGASLLVMLTTEAKAASCTAQIKSSWSHNPNIKPNTTIRFHSYGMMIGHGSPVPEKHLIGDSLLTITIIALKNIGPGCRKLNAYIGD
jgi:hypothetical protein